MLNLKKRNYFHVVISSLLISAISSYTAFADPLILQAGDSVEVAFDPNEIMTNPMNSSILVEVDNSNSESFGNNECWNILDINQTNFSLSEPLLYYWDQDNNSEITTVGLAIANEAMMSEAVNFNFDDSQTYSIWCVAPEVSPWYFDTVGEVELTFGGMQSAWVLILGPNSFIVAGESSGSNGNLPTAAQIAAMQQVIEAALAKAKQTLYGLLQSGKLPTLAQYREAGFKINSEVVAQRVNAALLKLPVENRVNEKEISAIIKVEDFLSMVSNPATQKNLTSGILTDLGLVSSLNPNKTSVAIALKNTNASDLSSMEKIQEIIKLELASIQARKDRLAAVKAKIAARNK